MQRWKRAGLTPKEPAFGETMQANPYRPPESEQLPVDHRDSVRNASAIDRILVRIHHWTGINLLGVLLPLFGIGIGAALLSLAETTKVAIPIGAAFLVGWLFPFAADILWRQWRNAGDDWSRFVRPFAGAAIGYAPLWMLFAGLSVIIVLIAVIQR